MVGDDVALPINQFNDDEDSTDNIDFAKPLPAEAFQDKFYIVFKTEGANIRQLSVLIKCF